MKQNFTTTENSKRLQQCQAIRCESCNEKVWRYRESEKRCTKEERGM